MPIVTIYIPEEQEPLELSVEKGTALLIGRCPDTAQLDAELKQELIATKVRLIVVSSPRVSANHLLVSYQDELLQLRDLQSRNGTWQQLPRRGTCTLMTSGEVVLTLSSALLHNAELPGPQLADWGLPQEFAPSLARAVAAWLTRLGLDAEVEVRTQGPPTDEALGLPLHSGEVLVVSLSIDTTHERSWQLIQDRLVGYVHQENRRYSQLTDHEEGVVFVSPLIRAVHSQVAEAAMQSQRLVLLGPTGSGKEVLAHCYHRHSPRNRGPFVAINCALLREDLLYAQLFGARRGSFTGCVADMIGLVDAAHDGTLFLDEIAELDAASQRALLRFLDSRGEYHRLGEVRPRRADVQIVCATHLNLADPKSRAGRFREDLWYRLGVRIVHVPALAERTEDIVALLRSRRLRGSALAAFDALSPDALALVLRDPWPGNLRDLDNFLERLPPAARRHSLDDSIVRRALSEGRALPPSPPSPHESQPAEARLRALDERRWSEVTTAASRAFLVDFGGPPRGWGQVQTFTEKYLKPVFIAHAAGLERNRELHENINYSALARRLSIADGSTIKGHLLRYFDRFRNERAAGKSQREGAA